MLNISNIMSCSNNLKNKMCPSGPMTPIEMHPYFEVSGTTAHMKLPQRLQNINILIRKK